MEEATIDRAKLVVTWGQFLFAITVQFIGALFFLSSSISDFKMMQNDVRTIKETVGNYSLYSYKVDQLEQQVKNCQCRNS